ncbi:MAG TPA: hypothetical protein VIR30_15500 [Nocardioides sp.]
MPKPKPMTAFRDNMSDAHALVRLARATTTKRTYRMRRELRGRVGGALRLAQGVHDQLDCVESDDLFIVILPSSSLKRGDFEKREPLLRQALVAGCAAVETFLADSVTAKCRSLTGGPLPSRLGSVPMTVAQWRQVNGSKYPRRAITDKVLAPHVAEAASTAPSRVGELLSVAGVERPMRALDNARGVAKGTTESDLDRITKRRNRIAHQGDRDGRSRAAITEAEVEDDLTTLTAIVEAIEQVLAA